MRCLSCNCELTDHEAVRKYPSDKTVYVDLCDYCYSMTDLADPEEMMDDAVEYVTYEEEEE